MPQTPETKVKGKVKAWLRKHAVWWTAISDRYHVGIPDFLCVLATDIHHGKLTAIEAKSEVGRLTQRQLYEANKILLAGGSFFVARPDDDEVDGFKLVKVNDIRQKGDLPWTTKRKRNSTGI